MWLDMFPALLGPPGPAVDIIPRQAKKYVSPFCLIFEYTLRVMLQAELDHTLDPVINYVYYTRTFSSSKLNTR